MSRSSLPSRPSKGYICGYYARIQLNDGRGGVSDPRNGPFTVGDITAATWDAFLEAIAAHPDYSLFQEPDDGISDASWFEICSPKMTDFVYESTLPIFAPEVRIQPEWQAKRASLVDDKDQHLPTVECEVERCYNIRHQFSASNPVGPTNVISLATGLTIGSFSDQASFAAWATSNGHTLVSDGNYSRCVPESELYYFDGGPQPGATLADFQVVGNINGLNVNNTRGWMDGIEGGDEKQEALAITIIEKTDAPKRISVIDYWELEGDFSGLLMREWNDAFGDGSAVVPLTSGTVAQGEGVWQNFDLSIVPDTINTSWPNLSYNDVDNTAGIATYQRIEGFATNPINSDVMVRWTGGSEGYAAVELGDCCGEKETLLSETFVGSPPSAAVTIPGGGKTHSICIHNVDLGGTNSSRNAEHSLDGGITWIAGNGPLMLSSSKPTWVSKIGKFCIDDGSCTSKDGTPITFGQTIRRVEPKCDPAPAKQTCIPCILENYSPITAEPRPTAPGQWGDLSAFTDLMSFPLLVDQSTEQPGTPTKAAQYRFDLSTIPPDAVIKRMKLKVGYNGVSEADPVNPSDDNSEFTVALTLFDGTTTSALKGFTSDTANSYRGDLIPGVAPTPTWQGANALAGGLFGAADPSKPGATSTSREICVVAECKTDGSPLTGADLANLIAPIDHQTNFMVWELRYLDLCVEYYGSEEKADKTIHLSGCSSQQFGQAMAGALSGFTGPKGDKGDQGARGPMGIAGVNGVDGEDGEDGEPVELELCNGPFVQGTGRTGWMHPWTPIYTAATGTVTEDWVQVSTTEVTPDCATDITGDFFLGNDYMQLANARMYGWKDIRLMIGGVPFLTWGFQTYRYEDERGDTNNKILINADGSVHIHRLNVPPNSTVALEVRRQHNANAFLAGGRARLISGLRAHGTWKMLPRNIVTGAA